MRKIQKPKRRTNGRSPVRSDHQADDPVPLESKATLLFSSRLVICGADWSLG
jgi:hypothetical protein